MKKMAALLLVLAMVLSLCACGSGNEPMAEEMPEASISVIEQSIMEETTQTPVPEPTPEPTPEPIWSLQQTVDEFGDVTENSESWITSKVKGDFSNTATASSDLTVDVGFIYNLDNKQYVAQFNLLEYNEHPATYSDYDSLVFKMKLDGTIYEYPLTGTAPNGGLFLSVDDYDFGANILFDELYLGNDVRCIIAIGDSQYNFTVKSGNFLMISQSFGLELGRTELSLEDVIKVYLTDDNTHMKTARQYFIDHQNDFSKLNSTELSEIMTGNYFEITIDDFAPYWTIYNYDNQSILQIAFIKYESANNNQIIYRNFENTSTFMPSEVIIDNDTISWRRYTYEIRKISDSIFASYEQGDNGEFNVPSRLMISYNDAVSSSSDVNDVMIPYILNVLIPEIDE